MMGITNNTFGDIHKPPNSEMLTPFILKKKRKESQGWEIKNIPTKKIKKLIPNNSIFLNASSNGLTGISSGFFVNPINTSSIKPNYILGYDLLTKQITYYAWPFNN